MLVIFKLYEIYLVEQYNTLYSQYHGIEEDNKKHTLLSGPMKYIIQNQYFINCTLMNLQILRKGLLVNQFNT